MVVIEWFNDNAGFSTFLTGLLSASVAIVVTVRLIWVERRARRPPKVRVELEAREDDPSRLRFKVSFSKNWPGPIVNVIHPAALRFGVSDSQGHPLESGSANSMSSDESLVDGEGKSMPSLLWIDRQQQIYPGEIDVVRFFRVDGPPGEYPLRVVLPELGWTESYRVVVGKSGSG